MTILSIIQEQNIEAVESLLQKMVNITDSRELSTILRAVRKSYQQTGNIIFLLLGRHLWENSPLKEEKNLYVQNAAGWILYDLRFKHAKNETERLELQNLILTYTEHAEYSPFEHTIKKVIDELKQRTTDERQVILELLNKLKPELLSDKPYTTTEGRELASDREKWYAQQSKLRFELGSYNTCINASEAMLKNIRVFHHDNNHWTKRRIALSHWELGERDLAKKILHDILMCFDNAHIYADLHRIYAEEQNMDMSISYGANAILNKSGEMKHKLKVLEKMAQLYEEKEELQLAYSHYVLLRRVREKEGWTISDMILQKLNYYESLSIDALEQKQLKLYWIESANKIYEETSGNIVRYISKQEKKSAGFIETKDGRQIYFSERSNRHLHHPLPEKTPVHFYIKPSYDRKKNRPTTEAIHIKALE